MWSYNPNVVASWSDSIAAASELHLHLLSEFFFNTKHTQIIQKGKMKGLVSHFHHWLIIAQGKVVHFSWLTRLNIILSPRPLQCCTQVSLHSVHLKCFFFFACRTSALYYLRLEPSYRRSELTFSDYVWSLLRGYQQEKATEAENSHIRELIHLHVRAQA